ncbi:MAG: hypothetical protein R3A80_03230 [Bdellovibrionota bacterium]
MELSQVGPNSIFCGRCAHPLPDETQSFCATCGAPFSNYPPTIDFALIVEHQLEIIEKRHRQKQFLALGAWVTVCLTLFFAASSLFKQNKVDRIVADRKVEFYLANIEGYPSVSSAVAREAVTTALQGFEDHFAFKVKEWSFVEEKIPPDVEAYMQSLPEDKVDDLASWQTLYRSKLMPDWYQNPYQPLRVLITNFPMRAPDFLRMETRHLSSSRLVGGFANPAFVIISSFRMLTEIKEASPKDQSRYLGEFLIAHELGHALLGLPDFIAPPEFQEFGARGLASVKTESPYSKCLMHTDEGGGLKAWEALKARPLGEPALCYSYQELLRAHQLRKEAIGLAKNAHYDEALKKMDLALNLLPPDRSLIWLKELWSNERRSIAKY